MECMQVLDPKGLVEEQAISLHEVSVEEHINKQMDDLDERMKTKEETKITSLRKSLHQYKARNSHLNQLNDHLMSANRMIRQDIEEINVNYA